MRPYLRYLLPLVIFSVLVGFFAVGLKLNPREVPSPLVNKPAPAFNLPLLGNTDKTFSPEQMRGQVWMLNVWASWCDACRDEHPVLMAISRQGTLAVVGLNYKDTDIEAVAVLKNSGNPYQFVAVDSNGRTGIDYGVYGVPESYIIDKQGIIRYKQIGPMTLAVLREKIMPLVKGLQ